jgi:regulator of protease activity HflC (stomatin/prohibitin superfamily)
MSTSSNDDNNLAPVGGGGADPVPSAPASPSNENQNNQQNLPPLKEYGFFKSFFWCGGFVLVILPLLIGGLVGLFCGKIVSDIVGFGFFLFSTIFFIAGMIFLFGLSFQFGFWNIPLGHRGVLLFFNDPRRIILSQGYHFLFPVIFAAAVVDVKKKTRELDNLKFFTEDNIQVHTTPDQPSITYQISDAYLSLGVDSSVILRELDNAIDQLIRHDVRSFKLSEVLGKTYNLEDVEQEDPFQRVLNKLNTFGIKILTLRIPSLQPVRDDVVKALESAVREILEKEGEQIEINFLIQKLREAGKLDQITPEDLLRLFRLAQNRDTVKTDIKKYEIAPGAELLAVLNELQGGGGFLLGGGRGGGGRRGGGGNQGN